MCFGALRRIRWKHIASILFWWLELKQSFLAFKNGHDSDNWDEIRLSRSWRAASASIGYFCGHRRTNSIRGQAAHNACLSRKYGGKMASCRTPLGGHLVRRRAYFLC